MGKKKLFYKGASLVLAIVMSFGMLGVPAFAAETVTVNEDGTATATVTTEISWSDTDGDTVTEGAEVTTEITTTDDEGRVVEESGTVEGYETITTAETQAQDTVVDDKDTVTETTTGDTIVTETTGEFEMVDSSSSAESEAVDPVFAGNDGSITVELTPGNTATGTAAVDVEALAAQLERPVAEDCDITDNTGAVIGHKEVTVEDAVDENGTVVGYTSTTTEVTTVTVTQEENTSGCEPEIPGGAEPVYDSDGNIIGYQTVDVVMTSSENEVGEIVLPERPAEYEETDQNTGETTVVTVTEIYDENGTLAGYEVTTVITDSEGNTHTSVETLSGTRETRTLTEVTDVTVTTVTFTEIIGGSVTTTTRTITTETKRIAASDRTVTAEMGNVIAGENDGILETVGVTSDVAEPEVGTTDQKTDLYHRADKTGAEFDLDGYDFQWLGEYGLESAIRVDAIRANEDGTASDSNRWQAHQFILVDKDGNEHTVYCADFAVSPVSGSRYDMENVEDADYYDSEAAAHIRAIALNGYWGTSEGAGSLETVKQMMVDAYNNGEFDKDDYAGLATAWGFSTYLTDGMALAATQAALWTYGNSGDISIDSDDPFTSYYQAISGNYWRDLDSREWALTKALYDYLVGLTVEPADSSTLINENNFATNVSLTVGEQDGDSGEYETSLTFTLAVVPDTESDDLIVLVVVDGEVVETRRIAGDDSETQYGVIPRSEDGSYTLSGLKLADGVNIDLKLTGTQNIGEGVYLFTSEVSAEPWGYDENGDPVYSSQTFVGIESGRQSVDLSVSLNFTVNEASAEVVTETASVTEQKTDTVGTTRTDTVTTTKGWTETAVTVTTTEQSGREWEVTWETNYTYPVPEEPETSDTPEGPDEPDKPEKPTTPSEKPEKPAAPDEPEETVEEDIPDENVPLDVTEDVPETEVPEEDTPLSDIPKTGDFSVVWCVLLALSFAGLAIVVYQGIGGKRNKRAN